jgi:hypothetical protein
MAFWSKAPEVNRQFRWYMTFGGQSEGVSALNELKYALKKAAKPTMKVSEVQHKYLNHFYYYPGRVEWDPITVSFAAVQNPRASQLLNLTTKDSGYVFPGNASAMNTISKRKAIKAIAGGDGSKGNKIELIQIDEDGNPIETWRLWNPFFTEIKFDSLEYGSEEILNLDATIKYDYATMGVVSANAEGKDYV